MGPRLGFRVWVLGLGYPQDPVFSQPRSPPEIACEGKRLLGVLGVCSGGLGFRVKRKALNPKPETLNPKPETLNPTHSKVAWLGRSAPSATSALRGRSAPSQIEGVGV